MTSNFSSRAPVASAPMMAAIAWLLVSTSVHAEEQIEEVIVTAQKREQSLQDVGVSVTAMTADQIKSMGFGDATDIVRLAPGVVFASTSSGGLLASLSVRGVAQADYSPNQESPNSIYIDDIYVSSPGAAGFATYDLQRIEVLRGPQGTLYGRNSTGGLAHFITAKPTREFEGYAEGGFGDFNQYWFEGAVSGPLSDRVRARLSGRYEKADGWWKNEMPGGKDTFETDVIGLRGHIDFDVTDELLARVSLSYDERPQTRQGTYKPEVYYVPDGSNLPAPLSPDLDFYGTGPGNDLVGYRDTYGKGPVGAFNDIGSLKNKRVAPSLMLQWTRGTFALTSLTNYTDFSLDYPREDCDGGPVDYCQALQTQDLHQWSQELRATGESGPVVWTGGLYFLHIDNDILSGFEFPLLTGSDFAFKDSNPIHQKTTTWASFGQFEWKATDRLRFTAGLRLTHDRKTIDSKVYFSELGNGSSGGTGSTVFDPPLLVYDFSKATVGSLARSEKSLWSGKLQVDYLLQENKLLYASVSRGVKGSGFNTNIAAGLSNEETPFGSESVLAYEIGGKFDLLKRRLRLNSSFYYYDYSDFQGFGFNGIQGVVGNYDAKFYGGETEVLASLPSDILLGIGAGYSHSRLQDIPTIYAGMVDQESVLAPNWTVNGRISKGFNLGSGHLRLQWNFDYIGERYASVDNNPATFLTGSTVHNARITYDLEEQGLEIAAFVNNVTDENREVFRYDFVVTGGYSMLSYAKPRWWGVSVRKRL